jgi:hypothetical protein
MFLAKVFDCSAEAANVRSVLIILAKLVVANV